MKTQDQNDGKTTSRQLTPRVAAMALIPVVLLIGVKWQSVAHPDWTWPRLIWSTLPALGGVVALTLIVDRILRRQDKNK